MPPRLVAGFCRCWLPKRTLVKNTAPFGTSPVSLSPSQPRGAAWGPVLCPAPVQLWDALPTPVTTPQNRIFSKGTLPEGTCHPHGRPDSIRHRRSSISPLQRRGPRGAPSSGCSARGAAWLSCRSGQQSPKSPCYNAKQAT